MALVIHHPLEQDIVGRDFVAFGKTERHRLRGLVGRLMNGDDLVSEGQTILQPLNDGIWAILFENVAEGENFTLELSDKQGAIEKQYGIRVSKFLPRQFQIAFPGHDAPIGNDFIAYGTTDNPGADVNGTLSTFDNQHDGITILQPTARGTWAIQFARVDDGGGYQLDVVNASGDEDNSNNLTVDSWHGRL